MAMAHIATMQSSLPQTSTHVNSNAWLAPLAFVVTHIVVTRFNLNAALYFSLQTLVTIAFQLIVDPATRAWVQTLLAGRLILPSVLGSIVIVVVARPLVQRAYFRWAQYRHQNTTQVHLYNAKHMTRVYNYISQNPTIFPLSKMNVHWGLPDLMDVGEDKLSSTLDSLRYQKWLDDPCGLPFHDTHFQVHGNLHFRSREVSVQHQKTGNGQQQDGGNNTQKYKGFYMMLELSKGKLSAMEYFEKMKVWLDESSNIYQYSFKVLRQCNNNITHSRTTIFKGKRLTLAEKQRQFWKSFFHNKKQMLATRVQLMQLENWSVFHDKGQSPTLNLLLHGPPGTGKSTFAYRLARLLDRHVVSIDMRSIDDKYELYCMLQEGQYTMVGSAQDKVFVFEEFDIAVQYLHEKQRMRDRLLKAPLWSYSSDRYDFADIDDDTEEDDTSKTKQKKKKKTSSAMSSSFTHNEFHLKDLLELLQGPVPNEGQIVIATTNHYDEIKKLCPALFRPGRLTPVYFGYFNHITLNEFCQFYFNVADTVPETWPNPLPISPAKLIEIALYALQRERQDEVPLAYFRRSVDTLLQ